jgi:hypothetical protein
MTPDELQALFPNASPGFLLLNSDRGNPFSPALKPKGAGHADNPAPAPIMERRPRARPLAAGQAKEGNPGRVLVRVTSRRRRLLDEDNLCEKYAVDCCRYAGVIPSDAPDRAKIEVSQEKVTAKEDEGTLIEIFSL